MNKLGTLRLEVRSWQSKRQNGRAKIQQWVSAKASCLSRTPLSRSRATLISIEGSPLSTSAGMPNESGRFYLLKIAIGGEENYGNSRYRAVYLPRGIQSIHHGH